jgi:hypothetical protein
VTTDREALREQYLAALDREIVEGEVRLTQARERLDDEAPRRVQALAAISDVTLEWLAAERDRVRAGGPFDEAAARRLLDERLRPG